MGLALSGGVAVGLTLSVGGPISGVNDGLELNYFYLIAGER
jgi:hypothetical protein